MEYWSDGVLECCYKVAGFATITPVLQCSEINPKSQFHGGLAFFLFIEPLNNKKGIWGETPAPLK